MRWGAVGLGDVEVATRLLGPSALAGPVIVRIGLVLALAGALVSEAAIDGIRASQITQRAAAVVALVALVPLFVVRGGTSGAVLPWLVAAAAVASAAAFLPAYARRLPRWAPAVVGAAGVVMATVAR